MIYQIELDGDYAYIFSLSNEYVIHAVDFSVPETPEVIGTYVVEDFNGYPIYDFAVDKGIVYFIRHYKVDLIDFRDHSCPYLLNSIDTGSYLRVAVNDGRGCILKMWGAENLTFWDFSDPANPVEVSSMEFMWDDPLAPVIYGDKMFHLEVIKGLFVLDISDFSNPVLESKFRNFTVNRVEVSGNYAFLVDDANQKLRVVDVHDKSKPINIISLDLETISSVKDLLLHDNLLIYTDYWELFIVDVTIPEDSVIIKTLTLDEASKLAGKDHYLFASVCDTDQILAYDLSNPTQPELVGSISVKCGNIEIHNDYLYAEYRGKMYIISIADPANMIVEGMVEYTDNSLNTSMFISDKYAYIDVAESDLLVVDIENPANPLVVDTFYNLYHGTFKGYDNYIYCLYKSHSILDIISLRYPTYPRNISTSYQDNFMNDICVYENYAYLAHDKLGLRILELW